MTRALRTLRHAGSLFLGGYSPEAAGDYATGSNHVLPTAGLARAYGALSVESFGRWMQVQRLTRDGLASIRDSVAVVAEAEGLTAHRRAVDIRFEGPDGTEHPGGPTLMAAPSEPPTDDRRSPVSQVYTWEPSNRGARGALRPATRRTSCAST